MNISFATYWRGVASGSNTEIASRFLLAFLMPVSLSYSMIQRVRASLYRVGVLPVRQLPRPVISVGNITVGGTGKTPVTAYIAGLLLARGLRVAVLSRGYGGTCEGQVRIVSDGKELMLSAHECGDEPYLLASTIPGLMVVIGADRYAAGILAMERVRPDVFLLDDGFQHLRLHRDLNILLMDYARPFGNGWCLPSGLLREPKSAALRADLVIYTRCPVGARVTQVVPGRPSTCTRHQLVDLVPLAGGEYIDYCTLHGRNVLAFAGIAEPNTFFEGLRAHGLNLVATICFPDHTAYDHETLDEIAEVFRSCGADMAITTEKDGVKLAAIPHALLEKILLSRLTLEFENPMLLSQSLSNLLQN